ncbi:MAG: DUF2865 domain-containing protein, partial [Devosia sp.]
MTILTKAMPKASSSLLRLVVLAAAALAVFALDVDSALAQSRNCTTLANTLRSIERNRDYRNLDDAQDEARQSERDVQRAESAYVRQGCNAAAKRGETLSRECRTLARRVVAARNDAEGSKQSLETGNAIAEQREAVLQEMARFDCNSRDSGSSAGVNRERSRGNLFDRLFDIFDGVDTRGDEFQGFANYETVRTVCVRKVDGYYWPISYSTLMDYVPADLTTCLEQCPGMEVDLYYYDNPGQEPEQMINLQGEPYASLPTAFAYRTSYDRANSCKTPVSYGAITLAALADGGNRAIVSFGELSFPLPLRDPRRLTEVTIATVQSKFVSVPL